MRHLKLVILGLTLSATLAGCAEEQWGKPGSTPQQFDAMRASCISRASQKFPPLIRGVPYNDGYVTPTQTTCVHQGPVVSCTQGGGQYVPPDTIAVDDNQTARDQDVRACFYENGWQPIARQ